MVQFYVKGMSENCLAAIGEVLALRPNYARALFGGTSAANAPKNFFFDSSK